MEGRLARLIAAPERVNLLILDDWGPEPLTADQRRDLLEIVDDRYDKGSLLITSQVPVSQWHDVIADPTLGDVILDRIIHNAHPIEPTVCVVAPTIGQKSDHRAPDRRTSPSRARRCVVRRGHSAPPAGPPMDSRSDLQALPPVLTSKTIPAHIRA